MEIKKLEDKDIPDVVELWYDVSIVAHDFISAEYWKENKEAMAKEYLPNSETYVAVVNDEIVGFIAMAENYLAALFVDNDRQGSGIGKQLLEFVKNQRETIQLGVFKKNTDGVGFYIFKWAIDYRYNVAPLCSIFSEIFNSQQPHCWFFRASDCLYFLPCPEASYIRK